MFFVYLSYFPLFLWYCGKAETQVQVFPQIWVFEKEPYLHCCIMFSLSKNYEVILGTMIKYFFTSSFTQINFCLVENLYSVLLGWNQNSSVPLANLLQCVFCPLTLVWFMFFLYLWWSIIISFIYTRIFWSFRWF